MARPIIFNAEPENYSEEARSILNQLGILVEIPANRQALLQEVERADVLIVRLGHQVDDEVFRAGQHLKAVVTATTGLDHIDLDAAKRSRVEVLSLRGERAFLDTITATAEHTWGLLLSLVRYIPWAHEHVCQGYWDRDLFKGRELAGKTLGIVGYGRLGRMVARYGLAFGMPVYVSDPSKPTDTDVTYASLHELLSQSDVVSLHVPLSPSTEGMIGEAELGRMRPGAWLINTSRGVIIDEAALLRHLASNRLGGAALDVMAEESGHDSKWVADSPLIKYARDNRNLLITPHVGGATHDSMRRTEDFMAHKLRSWVQQHSLG